MIYGDFQYYDPSASPIANVFEISSRDGREHFLLLELLVHVERAGAIGQSEGYVPAEELLNVGQRLGFAPGQTEFAIRHGVEKRLLQRSPVIAGERAARRYRLTTVGAYTARKLTGSFAYLDAVVVDTPIVDTAIGAAILDCHDIADRLERSRVFVSYLDTQWELFAQSETSFDWPSARSIVEEDWERIERTVRLRDV